MFKISLSCILRSLLLDPEASGLDTPPRSTHMYICKFYCCHFICTAVYVPNVPKMQH